MKITKITNDTILCMSNIRGDKVKNPHRLPFSFYFSYSEGQHGIRVKPVFDPAKISGDTVGTLKLCDDWSYIPGPKDTHVNSHQKKLMLNFFHKYHILFCAVWEGNLSDAILQDWFLGETTWDNMIKEFDFYLKYQKEWEEFKQLEENTNKSDLEILKAFNNKYHVINISV